VNTASLRVRAGLGTIARFVATGAEIYRDKLEFGEVRRRIERFYAPYHRTLAATLDESFARFGRVLLIDCHSMPSIGGPMERDAGRRRVDFVLGDCHGASASPLVMDVIAAQLKQAGFVVARNDPYAGGFTTRHYGRPAEGRHAFQIEINRALYMDEQHITRRPDFPRVVAAMTALQEVIIDLVRRL
jgi:N-formylglutamate amidohydrolase